MQHCSIAYLLTLVLFLEQGLHGTAMAITSSLDDGAEQGSTPDLQTPSAACHVEDLHVDFAADVSWNFILKPKSANIGQCIGSCSGVSNYVYYYLRRMIHGRGHGQFKEPCCAPIQYAPLQTLVTTYNAKEKRYETHVDTVENLVVKKCGCH
jgi:hypothetical protein